MLGEGGGGGSGGGVLIFASEYEDDAESLVSAEGGEEGRYASAGRGGGGRIALYADTINGDPDGQPFGTFEANWNPGPVPYIGLAFDSPIDLNEDRVVDHVDLLIAASYWNPEDQIHSGDLLQFLCSWLSRQSVGP